MLALEPVSPDAIDRAAALFHRDGFAVVTDALTDERFAYLKQGAHRVVAEQTAAISLEQANRGFARYSFGSQIHHPEWAMLVELPTILPIVEAIFASDQFTCSGGGGDYSLPGAKIQPLHRDMSDVIGDPEQRVTIMDLPTPFVVVNFPMIDFSAENGATRFIRGTHRSRHPIPSLADEPAYMQHSIACAPARSALIRDVRCWHGGTPNTSADVRIMTSVGYYAPWFRRPQGDGEMPRALYDALSERGKALCRYIVALD